jgi:hypothetical protein
VLLRSRYLLAGALGLWLACPSWGQEPPRLGLDREPALSDNQRTADVIADTLHQSGRLQHYSIDVLFIHGTAELAGSVADQTQCDEAVRITQGVPGVERVVSRLTVRTPSGLRLAQAAVPLPTLADEAPPAPKGPAGGQIPEPTPVSQPNPLSPYDLNPPRMPPYAWPTYAPYNNFSRVAYPEVYPYQAWPFIGPVYPFPKVPLGWRSVKLEFEDGYWWFSKTANMHDYWRIRYW